MSEMSEKKKTVVIYKGKYGSTKQYAQWIAEELGCDIFDADSISRKAMLEYDNIIFGGAIQAGGIKGFDMIRKSRFLLADKKVVVFAVGLNIDGMENRQQIRELNLNKDSLKGLTIYYCKGGFDPSKVKGIDRAIINFTLKMMKNKPEHQQTAEERQLYQDMTEGCCYTDKKYIRPIVDEFRR